MIQFLCHTYAFNLARLHLQYHDPVDFENAAEFIKELAECLRSVTEQENPDFNHPSLVVELGVSLLLEFSNRLDFSFKVHLDENFCEIVSVALSLKRYHSKSLISELLQMLNQLFFEEFYQSFKVHPPQRLRHRPDQDYESSQIVKSRNVEISSNISPVFYRLQVILLRFILGKVNKFSR